MTGLTLPGMMLEPGCRSGRWISPSPARGPELIHRRSLQILVRLTATTLAAPLSATSASWAGLGLEVVVRLAQRDAGLLGQLGGHRRGEPGRGVEAGAGGRAAQRQLGGALGGVQHPGPAQLDLAGVAGELLAEGDRHGVHQVGAAGLDDGARTRPPCAPAPSRGGPGPARARCATAVTAASRIAVGKMSLEDWPALTWSLGWMLSPVCRCASAGDHLVDVHVGRGARAGLEDVDRELVVVPAAAPPPAPRPRSRPPARRPGRRGSAFTRAAAALTGPGRARSARGMVSPEIGKFSTARAVWAPHRASAGTRTSPIESCSMRSLMPSSSPRGPCRAQQRGRGRARGTAGSGPRGVPAGLRACAGGPG